MNKISFKKIVNVVVLVIVLGISNNSMAQYKINTLVAGQTLSVNQSLRSENGLYNFSMQNDGNMCIYSNGDTFNWCAMTDGKTKSGQLIMQTDGNLVLYVSQKTGAANVWSTDTFRGGAAKTGSKLVLENNGTLVLYNSSNAAIWNNKKGRLY